jgi:hypothetical protein
MYSITEPSAAALPVPHRMGKQSVAIAEGLLLVGGVTLLERLGVDFSAWPVHPYLFVIMLMGAQHGVYGGVFTAMMATAITIVGGLPPRPIDENYFDYTLGIWSNPLLWVCSGLLIGIITTRQQKALSKAKAALEQSLAAQALIENQYEVLAHRTRKLERRLAGLGEVEAQVKNAESSGATSKARRR